MPALIPRPSAKALCWISTILSVLSAAGALTLALAPSTCPASYSRFIPEYMVATVLGPATVLFLAISIFVLVRLYKHPQDVRITQTGVALLLIGAVLLAAAILPQALGLLGNQYYGCSLSPGG
jgi:hypothetical protein